MEACQLACCIVALLYESLVVSMLFIYNTTVSVLYNNNTTMSAILYNITMSAMWLTNKK